MFIANATISPKPLPPLGRPLARGHAAEPADWLRWPRTLGHGSLSPARDLRGCDLSASNALGVCQYRGEGDRPADSILAALRHDSVVATPAASSRLGVHAHTARESDPASSRARDDRTAETIVQPPRGKVTLSSTLGTPKDSSLTELPIGVGTKGGTRTPLSGGREPGDRNQDAPIDTEAPRTTITRAPTHTTHPIDTGTSNTTQGAQV